MRDDAGEESPGADEWVAVYQHDPDEAMKVIAALDADGIDTDYSVPAHETPVSLSQAIVWVRESDAVAVRQRLPVVGTIGGRGGPARSENYGRPRRRPWGMIWACSLLALIALASLSKLGSVLLPDSAPVGWAVGGFGAAAGILALAGLIGSFLILAGDGVASRYSIRRKPCPHCGLTLRSDALVCRFCDRQVLSP